MKHAKRSKVPAYRIMMPFIMPKRSDAAIFSELQVPCENALAFIHRYNEQNPVKITIFYIFLYSIYKGLLKYPTINRFVHGRRIYDREQIIISFSMKPQKTEDSPLRVMKLNFGNDLDFESFVGVIHSSINKGRGKESTSSEKESAFFSGFPRFVLMGIVRIQRILDFFGMLPQALVRDDPFYSSVFVTSLGSIGVDAVFHHLYEYGNCPFFINIGEITEKPVAEQGRVAVRNVLPVRITFDERIEDGFLASKGLAYMKDVIMNIEKYL